MSRRQNTGRFRNSLTSQYLAIVLSAMLLVPILFPITTSIYFLITVSINNLPPASSSPYSNGSQLASIWHKEAASLDGASPQQINESLEKLRDTYPKINMFWVDAQGRTQLQLPKQADRQLTWNASEAIQFMKNAVGGDPFTVVAFIGGDEAQQQQGFMVMELPRSLMTADMPVNRVEPIIYGSVFILLTGLFVLVSWLFFRHIRKRLLRLTSSMTLPGPNGIPRPIVQKKRDEIGQLEAAYNHMVYQLEAGRQREQEEEQLRKSLIAHLSHDLRTPLTVIGSHIYSLEKEPISERGKQSLQLILSKMKDLSGLIDNLLSYSLLTSGRAKLQLVEQDAVRVIRESAAAWYPIWEKEQIEPEIELDDASLMWSIDEQWFRRVLDNLFQNVVRHAKEGHYIGIRTTRLANNQQALIITDRGRGFKNHSPDKGAGIGVMVVDYLVKEMHLTWHINSSDKGTEIIIQRGTA